MLEAAPTDIGSIRCMVPYTRRLQSASLAALSLLAGALASTASACGDDVVAYSETVSTKLSGIKPGDIDNANWSEEKNINTESGNPYGEFLKAAKSHLGGKSPGAIEPTSIIVRVSADSKDVIAVEEVASDIEVFFADSQTTIPVGHVSAPKGSSVVIPIDDDLDLEPITAAMLGGDFKVGARGKSVASPPADFELKLTLDIKFLATE